MVQKLRALAVPLEQWPLTLQMLRPFNIMSQVSVTPNHKIMSLPPHNCNFATVMNRYVSISVFRCS